MQQRNVYLIWLLGLLLAAGPVGAQSVTDPNRVVLKDEFYNNKLLTYILDDLRQRFKARIEYDPALCPPNQRVTVWFADVSIEQGLKQMIKDDKLPLKLYTNPDGVLVFVSKTAKVQPNQIGSAAFRGNPERTQFALTGRIVDSKTGESLPFATLYVRNGPKVVASKTNVDGYFTLGPVPADTCGLYLSYVGYRSTRYFMTPQTPLTGLTIQMEPTTSELEEVVVTGEKTEVLKANEVVGMIKMTPKNLAKLPNVGERDPFRAFQLMPGVSASNESSSGLYVRGGTPDQTLVLYDGFTVYHVDHLFGFFSAFNYNALKDIQLYKGGFEARFGGRTSAVAEITGKDGNQRELNAGADLSMLSMNAFIESPLGKKTTVLAAVRRSWEGPLYNKIFKSFTEGSNQQTGFPGGGRFAAFIQNETASSYFYDLNAKLTYRPTNRDIVSWSLYNGTDNMDNSTSSGFGGGGGPFGGGGGGQSSLNTTSNDISSWGNFGSSLKWSRQWGPKLYSNALLSTSTYYSDRDNSRTLTFSRSSGDQTVKIGQFETNNLSDISAKMDFEYRPGNAHRIEFGGQFTRNRIRYSYSQNDTTTVLARDDAGSTATVYVQDNLSLLGGKLQLKPGLRLTTFSATGRLYTEPRVSGTYQLSEQVKLKGAAGVYYQFVKQINREDITQGNRNFWILANDNTLPVTRSNHLIVGGSYEKGDYLLDVELYQKQNTGVTEYTLRFAQQGPGGATAEQTFFNGHETVLGVDVLLQRKFGNVTGWIGYTLAEAKRSITAFSDKPYYSDQDVRHQFKMVGTYRWRKWDFSGTWIYALGRPYTSILGGYQVEMLDGTTRNYTNPSDKNANRFPAYHRLDLSAVYTFNSNWNIGFSVFNAYGRTNLWYKRYQIVNEDDVNLLQTTNVNYLGFTPNVILSWKLR
jgi:ferric enterobactin receptor